MVLGGEIRIADPVDGHFHLRCWNNILHAHEDFALSAIRLQFGCCSPTSCRVHEPEESDPELQKRRRRDSAAIQQLYQQASGRAPNRIVAMEAFALLLACLRHLTLTVSSPRVQCAQTCSYCDRMAGSLAGNASRSMASSENRTHGWSTACSSSRTITPSIPIATRAARSSSGGDSGPNFLTSPDARTMCIERTKSESDPQCGLVPWEAVATAPPTVTSGKNDSDGSDRLWSASACERSPRRTPASTVTILLTRLML